MFGLQKVNTGSNANAGVLEYRAYLSQTGTAAPVATVIVNTLSATPEWTYDAVGSYLLTLSGAFPSLQRTEMFTQTSQDENSEYISVYWNNANSIYCDTYNALGGALADALLGASLVVIRVHPA